MELTAEIAYCESLGERRGRSNVRAISFIFNEFLMPWWKELILSRGFATLRDKLWQAKQPHNAVEAYRIGDYECEVSFASRSEPQNMAFYFVDLPPEASFGLDEVKTVDLYLYSNYHGVHSLPPADVVPFTKSGSCGPRYGDERDPATDKLLPIPGAFDLRINVFRHYVYDYLRSWRENLAPLEWKPEWINRWLPTLKNVLSHEYQHLVDFNTTARRPELEPEAYSRVPTSNPKLEDMLNYYIQPVEVRAAVRGIVARATGQRLPVAKVLEKEIDKIKTHLMSTAKDLIGWGKIKPKQAVTVCASILNQIEAAYIAELERRYPKLRGQLSPTPA